MKIRWLFIPFALGLGLALALLWTLGDQITVAQAPDALADELRVCLSGCVYSSVQAAVNDAVSGDVIKVAGGIYTGVSRVRLIPGNYVTQVVCLHNTSLITVQGGYASTDWSDPDPIANPTTLDAEGEGRVFYIGTNVVVAIEGLNITGGDANGSDSEEKPVSQGGGVYAYNASGITFLNNRVFGNVADVGGGLYLFANDDVTFSGNTVTDNTAKHGGGLYLSQNTTDLSGNTIFSNSAIINGGGLLLFNSNDSEVTLVNNIIADNDAGGTGGGLYIDASSPLLLHTIIASNGGDDGVYVTGDADRGYGNVEMINTILVSHTVGINVTEGSVSSLRATLWYANGTDSSGNVVHTIDRYSNPDFDAANAGDYHIGSFSGAIDQGVYAGVDEDIDGDVRPRGNGYDIGADEYPDLISVVKQANPSFVRSGEQLVYTIRVTNYSTETYTVAITDVLPSGVTFTDIITSWTGKVIEPGEENSWMGTLTVTVKAGYSGQLINTVVVMAEQGETGGASFTIGCYASYLPLTVRNH